MIVLLGAVAFYAMTLLIGLATAALLFPAGGQSRALRLAFAILAGLALPAVLNLWCLRLFGALAPAMVPLGVLSIGASAVLWARRGMLRSQIAGIREVLRGLSALDWLLVAMIAYLMAVLYSNAASYPLTSYDGRAIWMFKAKILYSGEGVDADIFQDPARVHYHRDYPLMMPTIWVHSQQMVGHFSERLPRTVLSTYMLAALFLMYGICARFGTRTQALLVALLFAGVIFRLDWWEKDGGAINSATVDFPLSIMACFSVVCSWLYWREKSPQWLVLSAIFCAMCLLTKKEGLIILAVLLAANGVQVVTGGRAGAASGLRAGALWMGVVAAVWLPGFLLGLQQPNLYDEKFGEMLTWSNTVAMVDRMPLILGTLATEFTATWKWNWFWLLWPVCFVVSLVRWRRDHEMFLDAVILLWLAAYVVTYCYSPLNLVFHLNTSITRLMTHILPVVVIRCALFFLLRMPGGALVDDVRLLLLAPGSPARMAAMAAAVFVLLALLARAPGEDALVRRLGASDPAVRAAAAEYVGKSRRPDWSPLVAPLLADSDKEVRKEAIRALIRIKSPDAFREVLAAWEAGTVSSDRVMEYLTSAPSSELLVEVEKLADDEIEEAAEVIREIVERHRGGARVSALMRAHRAASGGANE